MHIPKKIDLKQYAATQQQLVANIDTKQLLRLQEMWPAESHQQARLNLTFDRDELGFSVIKGIICMSLQRQCQRCLSDFLGEIEAKVDVVILFSEAQADKLPSDQDYLILEDRFLYLYPWIEDEIILSLPMFAYHQSGDSDNCDYTGNISNTKTENPSQEKVETSMKANPFDILQQLK